MTGNPNSRLRHPAIRLLPLLLIALAALVPPSVAHGQNSANTPVTLVSNQLQTPDINATYSRDHGQAFTTGSETNGYTVTSVTIRSEDPNNDPIQLQICEVDDNTHPTADRHSHGQDAPTFGGGGIQLGFDKPIVGGRQRSQRRSIDQVVRICLLTGSTHRAVRPIERKFQRHEIA